MPQAEFIRKEVAKILAMKPHTIQLYTDRGIVTPDVYAPVGRGTRRRYSRRNLLELALVRNLGRRGISLAKAKEIVHLIRNAEEFDEELTNIGQSRYSLVIYDHDSPENMEVFFSKSMLDKDPRVLTGPYLDMERHASALVLNLTSLWANIVNRL